MNGKIMAKCGFNFFIMDSRRDFNFFITDSRRGFNFFITDSRRGFPEHLWSWALRKQ